MGWPAVLINILDDFLYIQVSLIVVLNNREVSLCKSRSVYNNWGLLGMDLSSTHFTDDEITLVFHCKS